MAGEYIEKKQINNGIEKKVLIVKGGWSCNAGYVVWAYVAQNTNRNAHYAKTLYDKYVARIGKRLFSPDNKLGGHFGEELLNECIEYVKKNNYSCDTIITMRTD